MVNKWQVLSKREVFNQYSRGIEEVIFFMPDGLESTFYIKKEPNSVAILAITKDNSIILSKQYRPGPDKILSELPGGYVKEGQNSLESAIDELLEETGYVGGFEMVAECFHDAYSNVNRTVFVARNCEKSGLQKLDKDEHVDIHLVSLQEFRSLLKSGQMTNIDLGYLALDYLGLL